MSSLSFKNFSYKDLPRDLLDCIDQMIEDYVGPKQPTDERHDAVMLTINPSPDVDFQTFINKVHRFANRRCIQPILWAYAFEQRSTSKPYDGIHVHMVLTGKPSEIHKWAYSTFNKMVGNKKHVNVKKVNYEAAMTYLLGYKAGRPKPTKQLDILFREEYNLEHIYSFEE